MYQRINNYNNNFLYKNKRVTSIVIKKLLINIICFNNSYINEVN